MASNSFGNIFKFTTWGESHGKAIGVVIDGCPAGLEIVEDEINRELSRRSPGKSAYISPRKELDQIEILSGVFEGYSTGAPISMLIYNHDIDSSKYDQIKNILRPGHANYTYLQKYGHFDYRGGGRASARETACRVAAGAIAKKLLSKFDIQPIAYIKEIAGIEAMIEENDLSNEVIENSPIFCPDPIAVQRMLLAIDEAQQEGDSLGGIVEFYVTNMPLGLGEPVYEKLEARLAFAMLSIPASKGFEIGQGFEAARMKGSEHNDLFLNQDDTIKTVTNNSGGILAGISNGMPLIGRVAFKPPSSIKKTQQSLDLQKNQVDFTLPLGSRHDPCVAIRAVPVVEAMVALVLADALLMQKSSTIFSAHTTELLPSHV